MRSLLAILTWVWLTEGLVVTTMAAEREQCVFGIEIVANGPGARLSADDTHIGEGFFIYEHTDGSLTVELRDRSHEARASRELKRRDLGGGPEFTERIRALFSEAKIHDFDFKAAMAAAEVEAAREHAPGMGLMGQKVRIFGDFAGTRFSAEAVEIEASINWYAKFNPDLTRLKALLDGITAALGPTVVLRIPRAAPSSAAASDPAPQADRGGSGKSE